MLGLFKSKYKIGRQLLSPTNVASAIVILCLLVLPYFIFGTSMHAEGDDSHLYFHYPELWIKNIANSSWMSFSTVGKQDEQFFYLPILYLFWVLKSLGIPTYVIQNTSFSLIFIAGFVFFKRLLREILPIDSNYPPGLLVGGMMYVFSPIILITPVKSFLAPVWLVGVLPMLAYLLVKFIKTGRAVYAVASGFSAALFAFALDAVPWLLGILLPVAAGVVVGSLMIAKSNLKTFAKRASVWAAIVLLCQAFWLIPFAASLTGSNSLGAKVLGNEVRQTFSSTVMATDRGNTVIDPLLNLFHRQIQEDFDWSSLSTYTHWYDYFVPLDFIFVVILLFGIFYARKRPNPLYWGLFMAFLVSLFLFTIHVGALEGIFLAGVIIPGFAMFRNFYNKFAFGYALIYGAIIAVSLTFIHKNLKNKFARRIILAIAFLAVCVNAKPFLTGELINANLQNTADVKPNIQMPEEYVSFMDTVGKKLPQNSNVFDIPFGTSAYTIVSQPGTDHAFSGKSPVKLLSGVNDFSGKLSFPSAIADQVNTYIIGRDYVKLRHLLSGMHINYIIETRNVPKELLESSLYDPAVLEKTDAQFRKEIYGKEIARSSHGNYILYSAKGEDASLPSDSFVAASNLYRIEPGVAKHAVGFLPAGLGYFLDANHVGYKSIATQSDLPSATIKGYAPGDKLLSTGSASIVVTHNNQYQIQNISGGGILTVQNLARSMYLNDQSTTTLPIGPLVSTDLIQIGGQAYSPQTIRGAVLSGQDSIKVLHRGAELTGGTQNVIRTWMPGDCNRHDKENAVSASSNQIHDQLILEGQHEHNSCQFSDLNTQAGHTYVVNFQYLSNMPGANVGISETGHYSISPFESGETGQWNNFSYEFQAGEGPTRIYLYSGRSPATAITNFRDISVHEYSVLREVPASGGNLDSPSVASYPATNATNAVAGEAVNMDGLANWSRGDCNALDQNSIVDFTLQQQGISLSAQNGHEACIHSAAAVDADYTYNIDFDYYAKGVGDGFTTYYDFDPGYPPGKYTEPIVQNAWHHVTINLAAPEGARTLTVYLYSGTSKAGKAGIAYKNFRISRLPKAYSDSLLVTGDSRMGSTPDINSQELAPHLYKVNVKAAQQNFFINFMEPYHKGWQLRVAGHSVPPDGVTHASSNLYSNGWYVDVDKVCREQHMCKKNSNGSYDIKMVAEFTPQKWFYIGVAVSGVTLVACIAYLLLPLRRRLYGLGGSSRGRSDANGLKMPPVPPPSEPVPVNTTKKNIKKKIVRLG